MPRETKIGLGVLLLGAVLFSLMWAVEDGSRAEALFAGAGGSCLFTGGVYAFLTWAERPNRKAEKKAADKYSKALDTPPSKEASAYIADRLKKNDNDKG